MSNCALPYGQLTDIRSLSAFSVLVHMNVTTESKELSPPRLVWVWARACLEALPSNHSSVTVVIVVVVVFVRTGWLRSLEEGLYPKRGRKRHQVGNTQMFPQRGVHTSREHGGACVW